MKNFKFNFSEHKKLRMAFGNDHKPLNGLEQFQKHFDFKPFILNKNKTKNI